MLKLSKDEIKEILKLPTVNEKKNYSQNIVIREFLKVKKGVLLAFTGYGKGMIINKLAAIFNNKKPEAKILVIVPKIDLKKDIERNIEAYNLFNVDVIVINSAANLIVKKQEKLHYSLIIADEVHNLSSENAIYFSQIIPNLSYDYFLGLSATLELSHKKYLKQFDLDVFYEISISDGYKCEMIPSYTIYNIPISLTEQEKYKYVQNQDLYEYYISKFSAHDIDNPIQAIMSVLSGKVGCKYKGVFKTGDQHAKDMEDDLNMDKGKIIGAAIKWRMCMVVRKSILSKAENSLKMTLELLDYIDEQTLIFCSSIDIANKLSKIQPNSVSYHSQITDKKRIEIKERFTNNEIKNLFSVSAIREGFSYDSLRIGIRQGYNSTKLDLKQSLGRFIRFDRENLDKKAIFINIYVDDFLWSNKLVKSQQKKWLSNSLQGTSFCEWIRDKSEIII